MTLYLTNIARVHESLGAWDKAVEFYLRVIDVALGGGGPRSLEVCVALEDIAYCCIQRTMVRDGLMYATRPAPAPPPAFFCNILCMYFMRAFDISFSL